jgi:hypothetical protein
LPSTRTDGSSRSCATRYKSSYADLGTAIDTWVASTLALVEERSRRPRVVLLSYEQLVREPERVMRNLGGRLGITFAETLLEPTFNGVPIRADSSEPVSSYGILEGRADSHRLTLSADESARIDLQAGEAYEQALALVDR